MTIVRPYGDTTGDGMVQLSFTLPIDGQGDKAKAAEGAAVQLANKGWKKALKENLALRKGLNMIDGKVTYPGVAEAFGLEVHDPAEFLS